MSQFQYKFAAVLRYRKHQRDLCRQLLGQILAEEERIHSAIQRATIDKKGVLDDVREKTLATQIDTRQVASRRFYAGQLAIQIAKLNHELAIVGQQKEHCRTALVEADQRVQALEKLEEKQRASHNEIQQRRSQQQLEEAWQATQVR